LGRYVSFGTYEEGRLRATSEGPGARSVLDGLERAKWLGNMRVRIGGVRSGEEVRNIAFVAEGNGVVPYEKGRMVI
jgi:hypothetical protein